MRGEGSVSGWLGRVTVATIRMTGVFDLRSKLALQFACRLCNTSPRRIAQFYFTEILRNTTISQLIADVLFFKRSRSTQLEPHDVWLEQTKTVNPQRDCPFAKLHSHIHSRHRLRSKGSSPHNHIEEPLGQVEVAWPKNATISVARIHELVGWTDWRRFFCRHHAPSSVLECCFDNYK